MIGKFVIVIKMVFKYRGGDVRFCYQLVEVVVYIVLGNVVFWMVNMFCRVIIIGGGDDICYMRI